jgi:hypothetical protein
LYFDTSYIAKFYFNEPESVRDLVRNADTIYASLWALAEFHTVLHRREREGSYSRANASGLASRFSAHIGDGLWNLIPVTEGVLRRTSALMLSRKPVNSRFGPTTATCSLLPILACQDDPFSEIPPGVGLLPSVSVRKGCWKPHISGAASFHHCGSAHIPSGTVRYRSRSYPATESCISGHKKEA